MGEKLIDDLARALAEPMPRRKAVRLLGVTFAAVAVPGVRPGRALAQTGRCNGGCGEDVRTCPTIVNLGSGPNVCCPKPALRYTCGGSPFVPDSVKCEDKCPPPGIPCWSPSKREAVTGCSKFYCCKRPEFIGCDDGDCIPNCKWPNPKSGDYQCGKTCCKETEVCRSGKCQSCPGANTCKPAKGDRQPECCPRGTRCCKNNGTTACCGPEQECKAAKVKQATCECKPGTGAKCGTDCCGNGEKCCRGLGREQCCAKDEECCGGGDCCKPGDICCDLDCCDRQANEFCLARKVKGRPEKNCKKGCAPGNRCGGECCGTGFRCNKKKKACVPE